MRKHRHIKGYIVDMIFKQAFGVHRLITTVRKGTLNLGNNVSRGGIIRFCSSAITTIFETARPEFEKVKKNSIWYADREKSPPDTIARQLIVFADLQNPLLKKYDFDPKDFLIGAKGAIEYIKGIIVGRDIFDYFQRLNDTPGKPDPEVNIETQTDSKMESENAVKVEESTSSDGNKGTGTKGETEPEAPVDKATQAIETLKLTCHPSVYHHIVKMYKRMNTMFKLTGNAASLVISSVNGVDGEKAVKNHPFEHDEVSVSVDRIAFIRVYTDIVEAPEGSESESTYDTDGGNEEPEYYDINELHREYPIGSVVVTARVFANVTYTSSKSTDSLPHIVMFRGCVSGTDNTELDWKIVEMN